MTLNLSYTNKNSTKWRTGITRYRNATEILEPCTVLHFRFENIRCVNDKNFLFVLRSSDLMPGVNI